MRRKRHSKFRRDIDCVYVYVSLPLASFFLAYICLSYLLLLYLFRRE